MLALVILIQRIFGECSVVLMESLPELGFLGCEMLLLANNRELSLSHHLLRNLDGRLIKAKIEQFVTFC